MTPAGGAWGWGRAPGEGAASRLCSLLLLGTGRLREGGAPRSVPAVDPQGTLPLVRTRTATQWFSARPVLEPRPLTVAERPGELLSIGVVSSEADYSSKIEKGVFANLKESSLI